MKRSVARNTRVQGMRRIFVSYLDQPVLTNKQSFNVEYVTDFNVELTTCYPTCVAKSVMLPLLSDNLLVDAVTDV